jgi:hypothetical protein
MEIGVYVVALYICGAIAIAVIMFAFKSHLKRQSRHRLMKLRARR